MKTRKIIVTLCAIALSFGFAFTSVAAPGDGIAGSAHDFSSWVAGETRVCAFCHTPHHATVDGTVDYLPLWSRDLPATTYDSYESATFDAGADNLVLVGDNLVGPSRLCMSCHDGSVAIDAYYGRPGDASGVMIDGDEYGDWGIGQVAGLSNDHPIGFDYETVAAADAEIISSPTFAASSVAVADVLYFDAFMGENMMTCSTCHDVHNTANAEEYFLYGAQADSAICLTCHDK